MRGQSIPYGWRDEIQKITEDFFRTQEKVSLSQLLYGNERGWAWPDIWIPYFGTDPMKEVRGNPDWRDNVVKEPCTLFFISTGNWTTFEKFGTRWMASFDPGAYTPDIMVQGIRRIEKPVAKVDIRTPVQYAEYKHKDDEAVPTKKWKYL